MTNSGILTTGIFFLLVILLRVFLFKTPIPCNTYDTLWKIAILKALLPELKSKLSIYN